MAVEATATTRETRSHSAKPGSASTARKLPGRHTTGRSRGGVVRSSASGFSAVRSITAYGARTAHASTTPAAVSAARRTSRSPGHRRVAIVPANGSQVAEHGDQNEHDVHDAQRGGEAHVTQRALERDLVHVGDHRVVREARIAVVERPHDGE